MKTLTVRFLIRTTFVWVLLIVPQTLAFTTFSHAQMSNFVPKDRVIIFKSSQYPLENLTLDDDRQGTSDDESLLLMQYNRDLLRQAEEEHRMLYEMTKSKNNADMSVADSLFRNSRLSFKNAESMSENLFSNHPVVALALFGGLGLVAAYLLGLVFLDGYISSPNPALNGGVPYFHEDVPTDEQSIVLNNALYEAKQKLPSLWFWD